MTKIKLHARNDQDHDIIRQILGTVRWTYNQCVNYIHNAKEFVTEKLLRSLFVNKNSNAIINNPWLTKVGYFIRNEAVRQIGITLKVNRVKIQKGLQKQFKIQYRSKKKQKSETFYVRRNCIIQKKNIIILKFPKMKPMKFWVGKNAFRGPILMDCKFQRTWTGEYYLCIPHAYRVDNQDSGKNDESLRVCSLDPGVRTFQTIFDASSNCAYEVAPRDMQRIVRLCVGLDKLYSKRDKASNARKRYSYKRASRRMTYRIQNLINEVHKQLTKHLSTNYDLIMIPKFEICQMIRKVTRKINSKTVRQMTTWAHYRFRERLLFKCRQTGCKVAIVDESWTSKTCSSCGEIDHSLGSKKLYSCSCCGMQMDRDINGAKNIFLKNYEALGLNLTLGHTSASSATSSCTETETFSLDF